MNVLIAGIGEHRDFALSSLRRAGHHIGAVDVLSKIPVDWCDWYAVADPCDLEAMHAAVAGHQEWDAVLCWEELAIDVAHRLAQRLERLSPVMDSRCFRDKSAMHQRLQEAGLPSAQAGWTDTLEGCLALVERTGLPAVVKPSDYGGSIGVRVVASADEVQPAFAAAHAWAMNGRVVVDAYVEGPEVSIETVTWARGHHRVMGFTRKITSRPPYCVELGHIVPADIEASEAKRLTALTERALDALGMVRGVSHAEIKLSARGPVIMEVAGRPAGDCIPKLIHITTGQNLYLLELAAVLGEPPPEPLPTAPVAAVRFFEGRPGAPVRRPEGQRAVAEVGPDVLRELVYWYPDGAPSPLVDSNASRLGYCILAGERNRVLEAYERAIALEPVS